MSCRMQFIKPPKKLAAVGLTDVFEHLMRSCPTLLNKPNGRDHVNCMIISFLSFYISERNV